MKILLLSLLLNVLPFFGIEAESFQNLGGWSLDQQFMDVMGSPYLLAHGCGRPVEDATTIISSNGGTHYIYVRTYNWVAPFAGDGVEGPGKFQLLVNGKACQNLLGTTGSKWEWQFAGKVKLKKGENTLALHDLTGFEGRCDKIIISRKPMTPQEPYIDSDGNWNPGYKCEFNCKEIEEDFDLVVIGGGYSGICAAVSAARLGLKVALVNDRPVLGGNNSSEVRVQMGGSIECEPYPNLGNLLKEFAPDKKGNAMPAEYYRDDLKLAIVQNEPNIELFLGYHAIKVETENKRIRSVTADNITRPGDRIKFRGRLFADCTGDGTLGYLAGADWTMGREGKSDYGESGCPKVADSQVLGASLQWYSVERNQAVDFPEFSYGLEFCDESVQKMTKGSWTWETGMRKDPITEAEQVRDYGVLAIYANWSYLKNHSPWKEEFAKSDLEWMAYIAGKRESRRLLGDYVLTQNDMRNEVIYEDATCTASWTLDLHYPDPENTKYFPGKEFKSICVQEEIPLYPMPYRCFYSRNIDNLFMAGRDVSVTHVALGSVRVMRTCAMMGEVVGMAAAVCRSHDSLPRSVYTDYFSELQALMTEGCGKKDLPNNQLTNVGRNAHHYYEINLDELK